MLSRGAFENKRGEEPFGKKRGPSPSRVHPQGAPVRTGKGRVRHVDIIFYRVGRGRANDAGATQSLAGVGKDVGGVLKERSRYLVVRHRERPPRLSATE